MADPGRLEQFEFFWRDHYDWFLEQGYQLRPRYNPKWVPSWELDKNLRAGRTEDSLFLPNPNLNDAVQLSDNRHVALKKVNKTKHPHEISIMEYFSEEDLSTKSENHVVPLLAVLHPPGEVEIEVVVIPILRAYDDPPLETLGEAVDYIRQILEGFAFLHEHRVAHRDVRFENIMMDPSALEYERFHFFNPNKRWDMGKPAVDLRAANDATHKYTRTERRPKYYIIDFGFSTQYSPDEMPPSENPKPATDNTAPEFKDLTKPCDPFPLDVYVIGNMIRMDFLDGHVDESDRRGFHGVEFLRPLVDAMMKEKPEERITMKEAVTQFEEIVSKLSNLKLRSRVVPLTKDRLCSENPFAWVVNSTVHWSKAFNYTIRGLPAIPAPPSS
ncbi:other/AgaK1 protein kinase [Coprinopsis cinerea okayama7|uniref:Other/AgaK1 protein kinase n=1 Tax=Coprinopsis cinerea (strain Okayama-7 / 130 / ATCC MYA-4618 / FGSC 9003) TaxID=240176 RepID=A8P7Z5_COPC7|nr:other/AgaK1 protein kinase [Coprinopsis cinerea okayama7\|eukprot:XP_001839463.1 other/AgaK1 protein kinase [Coprinopsis cinerea okayama7\